METITLILPLEATTMKNPSDSKSVSGVTAGVTAEQQQDRWQSKMEPRTYLRSLNARIQGYYVSTLTVFYNVELSNSRKTQARDSHQWQILP